MNYPIQNPARGRVFIDGGGSATAFAGVAGSRWVLTNGFIAWQNVVASVTFLLYEIDSTNSNPFIQLTMSTTGGFCSMELGDVGNQASTTGTRLMMNTGAVVGTFTAVFSGYYTGS
jgi:hypothetical protein